jgi:cobalt-zinc-cadmium efflux system outer membrane protein
VQVPVFYQGQGRVDRARAETRRQQQLLKARAAQVRAAARSAAARLTAARDRALLLKNVLLPSRERILQETQLHYNAMSVSVFQLLLARRDQIETARAYVDALRDYWTARAEVEQLKSGRLPSTARSEIAPLGTTTGARDSGH